MQSYSYAGVHGELMTFGRGTICAYRHDVVQQVRKRQGRTLSAKGKHTWSTKYRRSATPFAMVMTPRFLCGAGMEKGKGFLEVRSLKDGTIAHKLTLDTPPVFEGLAVAESTLFLSPQAGRLQCFSTPVRGKSAARDQRDVQDSIKTPGSCPGAHRSSQAWSHRRRRLHTKA